MSTPRFVAQPFFSPSEEELRFLPEGPRRLQGTDSLGWVAIQHGADLLTGSLNVLDLGTGRNISIPLPGRPGFFVETTQEGIVLVGIDRRLITCDRRTGRVEETGITVSDDSRVVINDGLAVEGGVLFGTKHLGFSEPIAALYFLDSATRKVHQILGGQTCSNGKVLMRDGEGATLIDIDSQPKTISRYRLDAGLRRVLGQSLIAEPATLPGFPDGMRPAPDGKSVIVAFFNPAQVADGLAQQLCLESGAVLGEWVIPGSPRVTCPELIHWNGKVMIVFTTAVEGMPAGTREIAPGAGSMYIADTGFSAVPVAPPLLAWD